MHWYKPVEFEHDYWFMGIGPEWCGVRDIPAWSLHRLCAIAATPLELDEMLGYIISDYYDNVINHIESLIKEGYFNKEYLV